MHIKIGYVLSPEIGGIDRMTSTGSSIAGDMSYDEENFSQKRHRKGQQSIGGGVAGAGTGGGGGGGAGGLIETTDKSIYFSNENGDHLQTGKDIIAAFRAPSPHDDKGFKFLGEIEKKYKLEVKYRHLIDKEEWELHISFNVNQSATDIFNFLKKGFFFFSKTQKLNHICLFINFINFCFFLYIFLVCFSVTNTRSNRV